MQIIQESKDEEDTIREADLVGVVLCAGRVGRHMEEKYVGRTRGRGIGI